MPPSVLSAFLVFTCITALTPGPNTLLSLSTGIQRGFKGSVPTLAGICAGFFCVMFLCCTVIFSLSSVSATLIRVVRYAGCAYIVWLAWCIAVQKPVDETWPQPGADFLKGFMLQFVNVKIFIYGMTAYSGFILPHDDSILALVAGMVTLTAIGSAGTVCWALAGAVLQRFFRQHARVLNLIMALLLLGCVIPLAFDW